MYSVVLVWSEGHHPRIPCVFLNVIDDPHSIHLIFLCQVCVDTPTHRSRLLRSKKTSPLRRGDRVGTGGHSGPSVLQPHPVERGFSSLLCSFFTVVVTGI